MADPKETKAANDLVAGLKDIQTKKDAYLKAHPNQAQLLQAVETAAEDVVKKGAADGLKPLDTQVDALLTNLRTSRRSPADSKALADEVDTLNKKFHTDIGQAAGAGVGAGTQPATGGTLTPEQAKAFNSDIATMQGQLAALEKEANIGATPAGRRGGAAATDLGTALKDASDNIGKIVDSNNTVNPDAYRKTLAAFDAASATLQIELDHPHAGGGGRGRRGGAGGNAPAGGNKAPAGGNQLTPAQKAEGEAQVQINAMSTRIRDNAPLTAAILKESRMTPADDAVVRTTATLKALETSGMQNIAGRDDLKSLRADLDKALSDVPAVQNGAVDADAVKKLNADLDDVQKFLTGFKTGEPQPQQPPAKGGRGRGGAGGGAAPGGAAPGGAARPARGAGGQDADAADIKAMQGEISTLETSMGNLPRIPKPTGQAK